MSKPTIESENVDLAVVSLMVANREIQRLREQVHELEAALRVERERVAALEDSLRAMLRATSLCQPGETEGLPYCNTHDEWVPCPVGNATKQAQAALESRP